MEPFVAHKQVGYKFCLILLCHRNSAVVDGLRFHVLWSWNKQRIIFGRWTTGMINIVIFNIILYLLFYYNNGYHWRSVVNLVWIFLYRRKRCMSAYTPVASLTQFCFIMKAVLTSAMLMQRRVIVFWWISCW